MANLDDFFNPFDYAKVLDDFQEALNTPIPPVFDTIVERYTTCVKCGVSETVAFLTTNEDINEPMCLVCQDQFELWMDGNHDVNPRDFLKEA